MRENGSTGESLRGSVSIHRASDNRDVSETSPWPLALPTTARPARTTATRNSIGDKGVALLARSLRVNSSVETLALGGNRVTDEGAASIAGEQTVGSCNTISSSSSRQGCAEPRHQRLRAWAGFDVLRFSKNPC